MRILIAAAAALLTISAAPVSAAEHENSDCFTGTYREPLCSTKTWQKGRKIIVEERVPDVRFFPSYPFVMVRNVYE
jgi:hypothetical protein